MLNQTTLKSRATLLGKAFASKGITLSRAEQLDLAAQLEGARNWHHVSAESEAPAVASSAPDVQEDKPFDPLQLEVAHLYCEGDFDHVTRTSELAHLGDTLFDFVIQEVGAVEGNREEAVRLLRQAADELHGLADELHEERGMKYHRLLKDEFNRDTPSQRLVEGLLKDESKRDKQYQRLVEVEYGAQPPATETPKVTARVPSVEEYPGYDAVDSNGRNAGWKLRFLTDRFGDEQDGLDERHPDLAAIMGSEEVQQLCEVSVEDIGFVSENNGELGVLYESEVLTRESDPLEDNTLPEAQARVILQEALKPLEAKYPRIKFAVGGPYSVYDKRLAVWAFTYLKDLITVDEAKALAKDVIAAADVAVAQSS